MQKTPADKAMQPIVVAIAENKEGFKKVSDLSLGKSSHYLNLVSYNGPNVTLN